jgi:hypothetical protein
LRNLIPFISEYLFFNLWHINIDMRSNSSSSSSGTTTLSWVSACSTVVDHSQQEGFTECRCQRHVQHTTWRRTRDLERSNFRHKKPPASEATLANPAAEGGTMGEKWSRNFAESDDFHLTFGFFYMPKSTTWDRRLYFPSEGRRVEDFFARRIRLFGRV